MFLNVSGRTDIAAYYSDWLMHRIQGRLRAVPQSVVSQQGVSLSVDA